MESLVIRAATAEDMPAVLDMIQELAVYEKEPDAVVITADDLVRDGFGTHPVFEVIMADWDGKQIGFALYYTKYSTWKGTSLYLEDFIVKEAYRGKGIGSKLFEAVIKVAKERKAGRMEWQVLDWNEPAINFYKKYNATFEDDWLNCRFFFNDLQSMQLNEGI